MNKVYVVHTQEKEQGLKFIGVFNLRGFAMAHIRDNARNDEINYRCYDNLPTLIKSVLLRKKIEVAFQQDIPKIILNTAERDYIMEEVDVNNFCYNKPVTLYLPEVKTEVIENAQDARKFIIKEASRKNDIYVNADWAFTEEEFTLVRIQYTADDNNAILYMRRRDGLHQLFNVKEMTDKDIILIANFIKGIFPHLCQIKK